ncbi:unnamed protein product, partial [Discosporangium mesarthrocarpum]
QVDVFFAFKKRCRAMGITVPILPGYLPIQSYNAFNRFTQWCKTRVPLRIRRGLESVKDNEDEVGVRG